MTENEEAVHATGTTYADAGLEPPAAARPIYRSQDGPPQLLAVVECPECERLRRTLDDHLLSEAAETRRADRVLTIFEPWTQGRPASFIENLGTLHDDDDNEYTKRQSRAVEEFPFWLPMPPAPRLQRLVDRGEDRP